MHQLTNDDKPESIKEMPAWFQNFDLDNIVTPVNVDRFQQLMIESSFADQHPEKFLYLVDGFRNGFSLKYKGPCENIRRTSRNLRLTVGNKTDLWNKVMKEVKLKRYAGPFADPPYDNFIQSPIGLVPKDGGKDTRLIFHLSYPRTGEHKSVNAWIDEADCTVKYPDFEKAIELCQLAGKSANVGKSDMKSAFRNVPLRVLDFCLLLMKAENPADGKTYFFVDKCLLFGSSISCVIFQTFSDAVSFIVTWKTKHDNLNYLDDFLFVSFLKQACDQQLEEFIRICGEINFPVVMEKTMFGATLIVFLGLLINTENQLVSIPIEKVERAVMFINTMLNAKKRKATVLQIQKLAGLLNFLCRSIVPGRAFTRRLYSLVSSKLKPHHHVKLPLDVIEDLKMWLQFLKADSNVYCRPFLDFGKLTAEDIELFSDSSRNKDLGMGAYCQNSWMQQQWDPMWFEKVNLSIAFLELYAVTAAVITWIHQFKNKRVDLFCDNEGVVQMINSSTSRCKNCMTLQRLIMLQGMKNNVRIYAKHIKSENNMLSDALSRLQFDRFWNHVPATMEKLQTPVPEEIWPIDKIWIA